MKHKDVIQVKHTALLQNHFSFGIKMGVELLIAKHSTKWEEEKFMYPLLIYVRKYVCGVYCQTTFLYLFYF